MGWSCQIEATTATTKTKNQNQKMNNNDWTWEDEVNHLIEGIEIEYENLEEEA